MLSVLEQNGARVSAVNAPAAALGLVPGMPLADARAIHPALGVAPADPDGDAQGLRRLALWCQRYSPLTRIDAPDGVSIDIAGCAHLFGGEEALMADLADRLHGFGLTARLALAPTLGAAWALSRYGDTPMVQVAPGEVGEVLAPLPVAALRIEAETARALTRLGLDRIGLLVGKPRAPLAGRFGPLLVLRLDQALGREGERFDPVEAAPVYRIARNFAEPVVTLEAIGDVAARLVGELAGMLQGLGKAARRLELALYRVDGWREALELRITRPSNDAVHLLRLLGERLDRLRDHAGFGFEAAVLSAFEVERTEAVQAALSGREHSPPPMDDLDRLLDRLVNRFGPERVSRFAPRESHVPERSCHPVSALAQVARHDWAAHGQALHGGVTLARPPLLFARPEPVEVLVEMPDKPPARFEWRRTAHRIVRAEGPERIAPEWWAGGEANRLTRDYYRVEDTEGRRFWLFREGLYDRSGDTVRWFVHGLFA